MGMGAGGFKVNSLVSRWVGGGGGGWGAGFFGGPKEIKIVPVNTRPPAARGPRSCTPPPPPPPPPPIQAFVQNSLVINNEPEKGLGVA